MGSSDVVSLWPERGMASRAYAQLACPESGPGAAVGEVVGDLPVHPNHPPISVALAGWRPATLRRAGRRSTAARANARLSCTEFGPGGAAWTPFEGWVPCRPPLLFGAALAG